MTIAKRIACLGFTAAALAGAGCGGSTKPSAGSVAVSQYTCPREEVFQAVVAAVEQAYEKASVKDATEGTVVGNPRWYDKDGAVRPEKVTASDLKEGDVVFAPRVRIFPVDENFRFQVDSAVQLFVPGSDKPRELQEGDPARPAWVQTRLDVLAVDVHSRLKSCTALVREPH